MVWFYSVSESRSPPEGDTTLFLSRLSTIWKGFINMQSVAKFVTKAYPVSGCLDYLSEVRTKKFPTRLSLLPFLLLFWVCGHVGVSWRNQIHAALILYGQRQKCGSEVRHLSSLLRWVISTYVTCLSFGT